MKPAERPMFSAETIKRRVRELAKQISKHYAGKAIVVIPVLKGALPFAADLMRLLSLPVTVDFIRARSYQGKLSKGSVEILILPTEPLAGRHILLVEDILDSGRTTAAVIDRLEIENPASIALAVLIDKASTRVMAIEGDYVGFEIDDVFVVGYGMDYNERFRELPAIHRLLPD